MNAAQHDMIISDTIARVSVVYMGRISLLGVLLELGPDEVKCRREES